MKFKVDFKEVEQFIGKKVVKYSRYCDEYYEGTIVDFSINKDFNDKQVYALFEVKVSICESNGRRTGWVSSCNFKKDWGFKDTPFAKHLLREYERNKNKKDIYEKEKKYKYPECLKPGYKEAYEQYSKSNGTIYWPIQERYSHKWSLNSENETEIYFWNRKAYVSPKNSYTYHWSEFKLNNLGKKFFLTKEEGEKAVEKLNMEEK